MGTTIQHVLLHRAIPWTVAAGMLTLLVSLGLWQLDRAAQKHDMQEALQAAGEAMPRRIRAGQAGTLEELPRFTPVVLYGNYVSDRQVLLDAQIHDGRAGYRVWTPLALDDRDWVVVDRGWVPAHGDRGVLPEIGVEEDAREVHGYTSPLPRPGIRTGRAGNEQDSWPRRLVWPERADLEAAWGREMPARIVLLHEDAPDGFIRDWDPSAGIPPARHIAYAVQWFALALALAIIIAVIVVRNRGQESHARN